VIGAFASYVLFTLGWVLFGLASLRARVFPVVICLALVVGGVLGFIASPPYGVPIGLAISSLGAYMLRTRTAPSELAGPAMV
jgi:apolipoprotein N-acyltransferase